MTSCSSDSHQGSSHPYHSDRSRSTASLESKKEGRFSLRRLLPSSRREGLLPLPEGAHLLSSSPPPVLLTLPHMSLELPHPACTPNSLCILADSTWAVTPDPSPQPPVMILGVTGMPLHHPQPISIPMSFGTMLTFHTAPTSPPITAHQATEPCLQQTTETPHSGIGSYRTRSSHLSLYQPSRNPSPASQPPISISQDTVTGRTLRSSISHITPCTDPHEQPPGSNSPTDSENSHSLRQSYLCPPSHDMDVGQERQAGQTPSISHAPALELVNGIHRSSPEPSPKLPLHTTPPDPST